jgi:hypothetical protein
MHEIEARTTLQAFRNDAIVRRAAAYAIQTFSEAETFLTTGSPISRHRQLYPPQILSHRQCHSVGDHHDRYPRPDNRDGGKAGRAGRRRPVVKWEINELKGPPVVTKVAPVVPENMPAVTFARPAGA